MPILTNAERCEAISACKYVDEVIPSCPLVTSAAFMDEHNIDMVAHGDDYTDDKIGKYYAAALHRHAYFTVRYSASISTTEIISRLKRSL